MTSIPQQVIDSIESGQTQITRRSQITERDGVTPWTPIGDQEDVPRLLSGNVSLDSSRDERATFDCTLSNRDNKLRMDSRGGFWYDKRLKFWRGVKYSGGTIKLRVAIIDAQSLADGFQAAQVMRNLYAGEVVVDLDGTDTLDQVQQYDVLVAYRPTSDMTKVALLNQAYKAGKRIITICKTATSMVSWIATHVAAASNKTLGITPVSFDTPLNGGWSQAAYGPYTATLLTAVAPDATVVSTALDGSTSHYTAVIAEGPTGGRWFHYHGFFDTTVARNTNLKTLIMKGVKWVRNIESTYTWEYQLGVFAIDNISSNSESRITTVSGRDLTKTLMGSKFERDAVFKKGTAADDMIRSIAVNAGFLSKNVIVPQVSTTLPADYAVARGTPRFDVMKEAAKAMQCYLYVDNMGVLRATPLQDPTNGKVSQSFQTGEQGNLVTYDRSATDSELFNHVVVIGDPPSNVENALGFFGEARNTTASSPTSVQNIGDRYTEIQGNAFKSNAECAAFAAKMLKYYALESYDINFSSLVYPWMQPETIIGFDDPDALPGEPDKFLLSSLSIPLGLETMTANAKRLMFINPSDAQGNPVDPGDLASSVNLPEAAA